VVVQLTRRAAESGCSAGCIGEVTRVPRMTVPALQPSPSLLRRCMNVYICTVPRVRFRARARARIVPLFLSAVAAASERSCCPSRLLSATTTAHKPFDAAHHRTRVQPLLPLVAPRWFQRRDLFSFPALLSAFHGPSPLLLAPTIVSITFGLAGRARAIGTGVQSCFGTSETGFVPSGHAQ